MTVASAGGTPSTQLGRTDMFAVCAGVFQGMRTERIPKCMSAACVSDCLNLLNDYIRPTVNVTPIWVLRNSNFRLSC